MNIHYPSGAEALLIALQTPSEKGYIGLPVLIWGLPGVGKSSFLESLHHELFPVLTLIASIHDPTDFSGLPVHHEGKVKYAVPEWVKDFDRTGEGILFLDELTTAAPSVQAALLRVVLERKVGFHALPPGVRIVAAANPPDLMVGGWELTPPLRNRFVHIEWKLETETYLTALINGWEPAKLPEIDPGQHQKVLPDWKLKINAFLKLSPDLLQTSPEQDTYAFASPRSWDFAAALLASCDLLGLAPGDGNTASTICLQLIKGCIGEGPAVAFFEFIKKLSLPDPEKVLDGTEKVEISTLNDSELYILFGSLNRVLMKRMQGDHLLEAAHTYFNLIEEVFTDGRRDLIYVALKKISKAGLLVKAMIAAQKEGEETGREMVSAIKRLFADEGLKEFIDVFETGAS
jgi:hypothetical protein